jgi:hypothetical protein
MGLQLTMVVRREREAANKAWLEDIALRLVCVLALDRFGDYLTEHVRTQRLTLAVICRRHPDWLCHMHSINELDSSCA